jgi:[NiFe]-hydrogenase assembly, chaperone, HybE
MAERTWRLYPEITRHERTMTDAIERRFGQIYHEAFPDTFGINRTLPVTVRAFRCIDDYVVCLLLTPWMFARLFLPAREPPIELPRGWSGAERRGEPYVVLGPSVTLPLSGGGQPVHLNFDPALGHYFLQPLALAMEDYETAEDVFRKWNEVIEKRDRVMEEKRRDCPWQKEVSRREFFARFTPTREP